MDRSPAHLLVCAPPSLRCASQVLELHKKGVRVRIISDKDEARQPGSDIEKYRQAGIRVRRGPLNETAKTAGRMHHKFGKRPARVALLRRPAPGAHGVDTSYVDSYESSGYQCDDGDTHTQRLTLTTALVPAVLALLVPIQPSLMDGCC